MPDSYPIACECGFLLQTNSNLTKIVCSNPDCPIHNAFKLPAALEAFNLKINIGVNKSEDILEYLQLPHVMSIFSVDKDYIVKKGGPYARDLIKIYNSVLELNKTGITVSQYMNAWSFNGIGSTRCTDIFTPYSSIEKFYKDYEDPIELRRYIARRCNISMGCDTVERIANILITNKDGIIECAKPFRFKKTSSQVIQFTITKDIHNVTRHDKTEFKPRELFADYLNDLFDVQLIYYKTFSQKCNYLICDEACNTMKIKKAGDLAVTSDKLLAMLIENYERRDNYIMIRVLCSKPQRLFELQSEVKEIEDFTNSEIFSKRILFNFSTSLPIQDYILHIDSTLDEKYINVPDITMQEVFQMILPQNVEPTEENYKYFMQHIKGMQNSKSEFKFIKLENFGLESFTAQDITYQDIYDYLEKKELDHKVFVVPDDTLLKISNSIKCVEDLDVL